MKRKDFLVFLVAIGFASTPTLSYAQDEKRPEKEEGEKQEEETGEQKVEFYGAPIAPKVGQINLTCWDGLSSGEANTAIAEDWEDQKRGAVTVYNANALRKEGDDPDLMKLQIQVKLPPKHGFSGVTLEHSKNVKLWQDRAKKTPFLGLHIPIADVTKSPKILYIEGVGVSADIKSDFVKGYLGKKSETAAFDRISLTFMWVTKEKFQHKTAATKAGVVTPLDKPFEHIDDPTMLKTFKNITFNSNYGPKQQLVRNGAGAILLQCSNRVGFRFSISPKNVDKIPGVVFDITRQKNGIGGANLDNGGWNLTKPVTWSKEQPNDDAHNNDEDNSPKEGYIASIDAPYPRIRAQLKLSVFQYADFREYVRVRFNGQAFDNPNSVKTHETSTRTSKFVEWHVQMAYTFNIVNKKKIYTPIDEDFVATENGKTVLVRIANAGAGPGHIKGGFNPYAGKKPY
ncbi:MAG: hypothetical protein P1V97_25100 [Planctomycetota bacterium]|nr:hypothetical protein [Planctomycetota bacterium]